MITWELVESDRYGKILLSRFPIFSVGQEAKGLESFPYARFRLNFGQDIKNKCL